MQTARIASLLSHLRLGRWKRLPKNIGLKTACEARELGWVELDTTNLRKLRARITANGKARLGQTGSPEVSV
jgi:hypothetical protein